MQRYLNREPFLTSIGKHLTRDEIHDRDRARQEQEELNQREAANLEENSTSPGPDEPSTEGA